MNNCSKLSELRLKKFQWCSSKIFSVHIEQVFILPDTKATTGDVLLKNMLEDFAKFTREHLWRSLLLNKVAARRLFYRAPPGNYFYK